MDTIEFPCDYPIKVVGEASPDFQAYVLDVVRRHAPDLDAGRTTVRSSRADRYFAVTVVIAYVLLGRLLLFSGGSDFFTDIASALLGRTRGGSAKIAVAAPTKATKYITHGASV